MIREGCRKGLLGFLDCSNNCIQVRKRVLVGQLDTCLQAKVTMLEPERRDSWTDCVNSKRPISTPGCTAQGQKFCNVQGWVFVRDAFSNSDDGVKGTSSLILFAAQSSHGSSCFDREAKTL